MPPRSRAPAPVDLHGGPGDRRPLDKVFAGLGDTDVGGLLLLATTNTHGPTVRPFAEHGRRMRDLLCGPDGLCGRRFPADRVHVLEVAQPTVHAALEPTRALLTALAPGACLVTTGTGSYALGAGALLAAIETGVPSGLLPVDDPAAVYRLSDLVRPDATLHAWLLRHRFWAELAAVDPPNADLWRLLAARQRADTGPAKAARPGPELTAGDLGKLGELWPTVQAAFFERLARGEALDHSLLRAWFTHRIAKLSKREAELIGASARAVLDELADRLSDGGERGDAALIRAARLRLAPAPAATSVELVRDTEFVGFYADATTHAAHLAPPEAHRRPLPGPLLRAADQWEQSDLLPRLLRHRGLRPWPVLGSGDVLVLLGVGLTPEHDTADEGGLAAVREVLDWAARQRAGLARPGRVRLRLLASDETLDRAGRWVTFARATAPAGTLDAETLGPYPTGPADAAGITSALLTDLRDGGLRDVDEVLLVVNTGKPVMVNAMVAAGVQWSLEAACTLRVSELGLDRALHSVIRDGGRGLCRLGMDARLASLASAAMRRLDTRTAWQLLANGSPALTAVRDAAARLHGDLYGAVGPATGPSARRALARERLTLIAEVLADEPWPACYTAVEALRPGLFGWRQWDDLRRGHWALHALNGLRNETPYAHLLDRLRVEKRSPRPPAPARVVALLHRAIGELGAAGPGDRGLLVRFEELRVRLDRLAAE